MILALVIEQKLKTKRASQSSNFSRTYILVVVVNVLLAKHSSGLCFQNHLEHEHLRHLEAAVYASVCTPISPK